MTYAYQWQRCDSGGGACAPISGASGASYVLAVADVGRRMRVSVAASNSAGSATASSAATAVVVAPSTPPYLQNAFEGDIIADVSTSPFYAMPGVPNNFLSGAPGASGQAVNLQVNAVAWQPNVRSNSTATAIQMNSSRAGADTNGNPVTGQSTWYRVKVMFPSGAHPYSPVPGDWNWTFEWHNDSHTAGYGYVSPALAVKTDANAQHWQFMWRPWGGLGSSPTVERWYTPSSSVVRDHWYDLVVHFVWDTHASNAGGSGLIEFWVDGQPLNAGLGSAGSATRWSNPHPFPTLTTNPDGTHSKQYNALYNYAGRTDGVPLWPRPDGAAESNIRYDGWVVGPTAGSVGFTP
jgi:Polysaccharide lyase